MPCKNAVIPYLDELTPAEKAIQAVNTIVNDNGRLVGHNTDGCGYTQNLRRNGVEVKGKRIVLLGGGGAASAIAIQAALEGAAEIAVFNRRDEFWPRVEKGLEAIGQAAPGYRITLRDLVVTDVVYSPAETRMLREARAAGCRTCDGLGMLLCQGAEAFRLYNGLEMPIEEIRALLYA